MRTSGKTTITSSILTLLVIGLLFFATPASAVHLVVSNPGAIKQGQTTEFDLKLDIESGERIPINTVTLTLSGPVNKTCVFAVNGTPISGCEDVTITQKQNTADFGYGYGSGNGYDGNSTYNTSFGYGYGYANTMDGKELRWKVNWNTASYPIGNYQVDYRVDSGSRDFVAKEASQKFTIKAKPQAPASKPVVTFLVPDMLKTTPSHNANVKFIVTDQDTAVLPYWVYIDGSLTASGNATNGSKIQITLPYFSVGKHSYTVKVYDPVFGYREFAQRIIIVSYEPKKDDKHDDKEDDRDEKDHKEDDKEKEDDRKEENERDEKDDNDKEDRENESKDNKNYSKDKDNSNDRD